MAQRLILLVGFDPDSRVIFRDILEHHGYGVTVAADIRAAVTAAATDRPDLIICDVPLHRRRLPSAMDDFKPDGPVADIPMLMITADIRTRAAEVITKPVHPRELARRVRAIIGPAKVGRHPAD